MCIEWVAEHVLSPDLYSVRFGNSHLLFTYPPFAAIVFALCGLHLGLWALQVMWGITNVITLAALIYLSIRIVVPALEHKEALRRALLLLLPVLALNPVFTTVGLGQIDLVLCLLIIWDLATVRRIGSRTVPLGVATGLAAAIKLTPLIFVPYLVITRRTRGALQAVSRSSHVRGLPSLSVHAPHGPIGLSTFSTRREPVRFSTRAIRTLERCAEVAPWPRLGFCGSAAARGDRRRRAGARSVGTSRSSTMLGVLVCATTGLVISPITWVHHLVWVVPVIIWLAAGSTDRDGAGCWPD